MPQKQRKYSIPISENFLDSVPLPACVADFSSFRSVQGLEKTHFKSVLGPGSAERLRIASKVDIVSTNEEGGRLLAEETVPGEAFIPWDYLDEDSWENLAHALDGFLENQPRAEVSVRFVYPDGRARSYTLRLQLPEDARRDWSRVITYFTRGGQPDLPPTVRPEETDLRQLFSNMILGFALVEPITDKAGNPLDFRFLSVNPAFERLTGFLGSAILGRSLRDVFPVPPSLERHWLEAYGGVLRTGKPIFIQSFSYDQDRAFDIWAYRPSLNRLATLIQDVSEREKGARLIRRQKESLDLALDAAGAGTWSLDTKTEYFEADERCASLLGRSPSEIGHDVSDWEEFFHPDDLASYRARKRRCLNGEADRYESELRGRHKDGRWLWFLDRGKVVDRDPEGRPLRMIGTFVNQDRRKNAELAAAEKGARLSSLLDSMDDVAFFTDRGGILRGCNRALERLLGRSTSGIVGRGLDEIFPKDAAAAMRAWDETVLSSEKPLRTEEWYQSESGERRWMEVSRNPLRDEEGGVIGVAVVARDRTERHDAQLATELRLSLLEKSGGLASPGLAKLAVDEIVRLTASGAGFLYYLNGREEADLLTWSAPGESAELSVPHNSVRLGGESVCPVALCAREKRALLYNEPCSVISQELPAGSSPYRRCLFIPVLRRNLAVAVLGLVEKKDAYVERDAYLASYLADQVWDIIDTQISNEKRSESDWLREIAFEATNAGFWTLLLRESEGYLDERCARIVGRDIAELMPKPMEAWRGLCHPDDLVACGAAMDMYLRGQTPIFETQMRMRHKDGRWIWILARGETTERDSRENPMSMMGVIIDITQLKETELRLRETLADKETLLHELYHRTNNTLQLINAMLEFRKSDLDSKDSNFAAQAINSVQNKIIAISLVQKKLFQTSSLSTLDIGDFLRDLTDMLGKEILYGISAGRVLRVKTESVRVSIDSAIPFGIIVTELIENSALHGFTPGEAGIIQVTLALEQNDVICLQVNDNGHGPPAGFNPRTSTKMGLRMVIGIAEEQLGGSVQFGGAEEGFAVSIRFRDTYYPKRL